MNPWRRMLFERLIEMSDTDIQNAMHEIKAADITGRHVIGGYVRRLASEISDLMQTQPDHAEIIVAKAIIVTAAYRFAGLPPESKRLS